MYHKITVSNLDEIASKFQKSNKNRDVLVSQPAAGERLDEIDEGTDCASDNSMDTETGSPTKSGLGENNMGLGFEGQLDAALSSTSKTKSFFDDLKKESNKRIDEQLNQLKNRTNAKIDEQIDYLATKFCTQL